MVTRLPALVALVTLAGACARTPPEHPGPEGGFVITGAKVFDGTRFLSATNVHVKGGVIVGLPAAVPRGATVIDGRGHTLLPGLIDGHAHVGMNLSHLQRAASFGVVTVVDLFGPPELPAKLRAQADTPEGRTRADLVGAGNLATAPGGHGTEYGIPIQTISTVAEAPAFVAARKAEGSAILKIVFDNPGARGDDGGPKMPTLPLDVVRALAKEGRAAGLPVAVHSGDCDDLRALVDVDADVLAHGCAMKEGDDLPARLARKGVFFNPTLAVQLRPCGLEYWIPLVKDPELAPRLSDEERARLGKDRNDVNRPCVEGRVRLVREANAAGVRLIAGPDAPNRRIPFGAALLAEITLIRQAGVSTELALAAATKNPADAYRLTDRGVIAQGKRADLLLVEGDVEVRPEALHATRKVWKAGVLVPAVEPVWLKSPPTPPAGSSAPMPPPSAPPPPAASR